MTTGRIFSRKIQDFFFTAGLIGKLVRINCVVPTGLVVPDKIPELSVVDVA
jgi:hypothetical protein